MLLTTLKCLEKHKIMFSKHSNFKEKNFKKGEVFARQKKVPKISKVKCQLVKKKMCNFTRMN